MKIHISNEAAQWYKDELHLQNGDNVRFFARYGGHSSVQHGFSLGLSTENPMDIGVQEVIGGITFFIEDRDLWYFDDKNLYIELSQQYQEPEFLIHE